MCPGELRSPCVRIDAVLLIPGRGQPIRDASLIASEARTLFVGKTEALDAHFAKIPPTTVPVLMPKLWDCHVYVMDVEKTGVDDMAMVPLVLAGACSARGIAFTLNAIPSEKWLATALSCPRPSARVGC